MSANYDVIKKYNRNARYYDYMDQMLKEDLRRKVTSMAYGRVLEVGVGTGKNIPYYPPGCEVVGIDFSPGMLEKARERARGRDNITLFEMDAQKLQFPDNSFDTVLGTCVFCTVPDPIKGFQEINRVVKPDGQIMFLEHVRSANKLMGMVMDLLNPLVVKIIGSNINRETVENMRKAGLHVETVETVGMEILKFIIAKPNK